MPFSCQRLGSCQVNVQNCKHFFTNLKIIQYSNRVESECEQELLFGLVQPGVVGAFIGGNDIAQEANFVWAKGFQNCLFTFTKTSWTSTKYNDPHDFNFQMARGLVYKHGPHPGTLTPSVTIIQETASSCSPATWSPGIKQYYALHTVSS